MKIKRDLRGPFSWQTVNPPVPHTSPFPLQHQSPLSLNNELTNYVLTSKTRVKESKERENSCLKMITWKKSHKKSKNSDRVCARHCFRKSHHRPTKSNCWGPSCAYKDLLLLDLFNI